jgi:hypothetical protein
MRRMFIPLVCLAVLVLSVTGAAADRGGEGGRGDGPVVYVTSQDLYFDSVVTADPLPMHGPFTRLYAPGTNPDYPDLTTLSTEYGPGDRQYRGGRWWVDENGNDTMDEGDHFFSCPLLGPGRDEP